MAFAWEKHYPPGVRWDAPVLRSTIPAVLDESIARHGDKPAIEFRERLIGYDALGRMVVRLAAALLRDGLGRGQALALYLPNTPALAVAIFAAAKAGARIVMLSPLDAERALAHKLRDSGARVMITTNFAMLLPNARKLHASGILDRVIVGDDSEWGPAPIPLEPPGAGLETEAAFLAGAAAPARWPAVAPDDVALLQYTGGTTGAPKAAMLTHANLTAALGAYETWLGGQGLSRPGEERAICVLPLFHIYGLTVTLLRHVRAGNLILLRARFDVETTLRDIGEKRATTFAGVPTMWMAITAHPAAARTDFSSLFHGSSGGAPMPDEARRRFERVSGRRLGLGWGMTESSPAGTHMPLHLEAGPGDIGMPLPGVEVGVVALDDPRRPLPPGEIGELRIKGPNVTHGYWNRPDENAAAFVDGYFLTGDVGRMDGRGVFTLIDRKKDMIISGGFNVYPLTIEEAIYEHPAVEEAAVIGVPDAHRGEAAKAFVKLRPGATLTLEGLREFLADKVGRHEMPAALEVREALPRTPVGKISRRDLREEERAKSQGSS